MDDGTRNRVHHQETLKVKNTSSGGAVGRIPSDKVRQGVIYKNRNVNDEKILAGNYTAYKLIIDPQLVGWGNKVYRVDGVMPDEKTSSVHVFDPRKQNNSKTASSCKRKVWKLLLPKFEIDKNYVGFSPSSVTLTNLNDNISEIFLNGLSIEHGSVEKVEIFYHPISHRHLGLAHIIFSDAAGALSFLKRINGTYLSGKKVKAMLDNEGLKCREIFDDITTKVPGSRTLNKRIKTTVDENEGRKPILIPSPLPTYTGIKRELETSEKGTFVKRTKIEIEEIGSRQVDSLKLVKLPTIFKRTNESERSKAGYLEANVITKIENIPTSGIAFSSTMIRPLQIPLPHPSQSVVPLNRHSGKINLPTIPVTNEDSDDYIDPPRMDLDARIKLILQTNKNLARLLHNDSIVDPDLWEIGSEDDYHMENKTSVEIKDSFEGTDKNADLKNVSFINAALPNTCSVDLSPPPSPFLASWNKEITKLTGPKDGNDNIGKPIDRKAKDPEFFYSSATTTSTGRYQKYDEASTGHFDFHFQCTPEIKNTDYVIPLQNSSSLPAAVSYSCSMANANMQTTPDVTHASSNVYTKNHPCSSFNSSSHQYNDLVVAPLPSKTNYEHKRAAKAVQSSSREEVQISPEALINALVQKVEEDLTVVLKKDLTRRMIEHYGYQLFDEWQIAQREEYNRKMDDANSEKQSTSLNDISLLDCPVKSINVETINNNDFLKSLCIPKLPARKKPSTPSSSAVKQSRKSYKLNLDSDNDSNTSADYIDVSNDDEIHSEKLSKLSESEVAEDENDYDNVSSDTTCSEGEQESNDQTVTENVETVFEDEDSTLDAPFVPLRNNMDNEGGKILEKSELKPFKKEKTISTIYDCTSVEGGTRGKISRSASAQTSLSDEINEPILVPFKLTKPKSGKKNANRECNDKASFVLRGEAGRCSVLHDFQSVGIDEEDLAYLKIAYNNLLTHTRATDWLPLINFVDHPITIDISNLSTRSGTVFDEVKPGSARTRGFVKRSRQEKMQEQINSKQRYSEEKQLEPQNVRVHMQPCYTPSTTSTSKVALLHREVKLNQRKMLAVLGTESDVFKFNQLKFRRKILRFDRSLIHEWGLFAAEPISADEMIIEYVGEVIRPIIADKREKIEQEKKAGSSSYMFRVDDEVIDASTCGNLARFINHSCNPNCYAKVITFEKKKKIVIYAKRDIALKEEVTYDYKFPKEEIKIPCHCGASACRGTLN